MKESQGQTKIVLSTGEPVTLVATGTVVINKSGQAKCKEFLISVTDDRGNPYDLESLGQDDLISIEEAGYRCLIATCSAYH